MYKTSTNYKKNVYTCSQHELKIYIDKKRVDDSYIFDCTGDYELITDKFELGATPMQQIQLTLHKNTITDTCKEIYIESGILEGEIVPIGYFTIKEISDKDEYLTNIIANDYMDKFEFNFDGSKHVPCTTGYLVQKMCDEAGVELATTNFLNDNIIIYVYDNSITARKFIGMIAEQAGGFAHIGRDGKLYIKTLEKTSFVDEYVKQKYINLITSTNAIIDVVKIFGNTEGLTGTVDLCIDEVEKSIYLVDLFKQVYVNLLNGNLNISLPSELADIVEYSLDSNGNLVAYVYDIYGNKLDFSIDISGNLIADIDLESRVVISRNKISINLGSFVLSEDDYIEYDSSTEKWYIFQNNTSTEITNTTVLNSLNQLLDISLNKGTIEIYLENDVSAISMNCTNFVEIPIELFKEYEFAKELFKCTRLYYEDGIRVFDYGDKTGNTIYISSENMFIIDDGDNTSSQLLNVFNKVNGLELRGFKGSSIIDIAIDIGDIVYIDGEPVLYQGSWEYQGRNIVSISSKIQSKSKEESTASKISNDVKIRRIQSQINQIDGNITLLGEEITENSQKTSEMQLQVDDISLKVNNIETLTNEIIGTNPIILENCKAGELLELHIRGNNDVFRHQYPENGLYPSNNLYPYNGSSILEINNDNLRDNLLYSEATYMCCIDINSPHIIINKSSCRSAFMYVEPNSKYRITKKAGKRFSLGSFSIESPLEIKSGMIPTNYVSDENEGDGITELTICTGANDHSVLIFFYDEDIDTVAKSEMFASITIQKDYAKYDLKVMQALKRSGDYYDEYVIKDGYGYELHRIQEDGTIIENPEPTNKKAISISLAEGTNTINIIDYIATMEVKYVIKSDLTNFFATKIDLNSKIELLSNQILLSVTQELEGLDKEYLERSKIESSIDLGILDDEGYMAFKTNKLTMDSDYFKLDKNGKITATAGIIGKWILDENGLLYSNTQVGNYMYQSGLDSRSNNYMLYAGLDVTDGATHNLSESNAYITKSGLMYAKWFKVNGDSGYMYICYDSGRQAMTLSIDGVRFYLDNEANGYYGYMGCFNGNMRIDLNDSLSFLLMDNLHYNSDFFYMMYADRYNPNSSGLNKYRHVFGFNASIYCYGYGTDSINNTIRIQGYEVATNASDERLKENIKMSDDNAIEKINKILVKQFDWRKDKHLAKGGKHVNNGFIAQEVQKIDETLVNYNNEDDTYQMELLNLIALAYKGIQELSKKIENLK